MHLLTNKIATDNIFPGGTDGSISRGVNANWVPLDMVYNDNIDGMRKKNLCFD